MKKEVLYNTIVDGKYLVKEYDTDGSITVRIYSDGEPINYSYNIYFSNSERYENWLNSLNSKDDICQRLRTLISNLMMFTPEMPDFAHLDQNCMRSD